MSGQYSASVLDVSVNYMGENFSTEIDNVAWNGDNFTGTIDGINISGNDNNGQITGWGYYLGQKINATGVVTGWN